MPYYVYILASRPNGTIYVGVTNDVIRRVYEHKQGLADGFTKRYGVNTLVHFEAYDDVNRAMQREQNIKHWKRDWKIALIERQNPDWHDLYDTLVG